MADENVSSPVPGDSLPENPPQQTAAQINSPQVGELNLSPPKNEPNPTGDIFVKSSVGDRIRGAVAGVAEKYGLNFKKGRGRPRKDGQPGKLDVPLEPAAEVPAVVPAPAVAAAAAVPGTVDNFLLRRVVVSAVKGVKTFARYLLSGKARQAGLDDAFINRTFDAAKPDPEVWRDFEESLGLVLKKYNIKTEHDELLACGVDFCRLMQSDVQLWKLFDAEIQRRRAGELERARMAETDRRAA